MNTLFGLHTRRIMQEGRARRRSATRLPRFETLERRDLLAANLHADSISVTQGAVFGEQSAILARFKSTDLVAGSQFNVQVLLDGQVLQTQTRSALAGADQSYLFNVSWFARAGQIELRLDTASAIAEADETDNVVMLDYTPAAPILPRKFEFPVPGEVLRDWFVNNYVDVNQRAVEYSDFRGGVFTYDGHTGMDFVLSERFAAMDRGIAVYAVADGVVTEVFDGNFDRETAGGGTFNNYVDINHGNGISTDYHHLAANTVTVKVGDQVTAGQLLGHVGSSGFSIAAHLHFDVYHNGRVVETNFAPDAYWMRPQPYMHDFPTTFRDSVITNYAFQPAVYDRTKPSDSKEMPSEIRVFPNTSDWTVHYWVLAAPIRMGEAAEVRWYRPDGSLEKRQELVPLTLEVPERADRHIANLQTLEHARWSQFPGTWQVALVVNNREIDRQSFEVTTGLGVPEMRVTQGDTYIIDGRTTPIDFGTVSTAARSLTFTIQNHGSVALTTSGLELPPGFSLVGAFSASIAPGTTADFQVQLDTGATGQKFGSLRFHTNDADEQDFNFNIKGFVSGASVVGTPRITLSGPAVVYVNSGDPKLIAATSTVSDSDSINFDTGQLKVEFASGGSDDDRLAIRNEGSDVGQIGVVDDRVILHDVTIARFTGGQGNTPLIVTFNNASLGAVQALVRNLTFANVSHEPATNHRYVRLTLVDDTGKVSNMAIAHVLVDPRPVPIPPAVIGDYNLSGAVDSADYVVWRATLGNMVTAFSGADGNGNGVVDQPDYQVWRSNFGATLQAATTPVAAAASLEPVAESLGALDGTEVRGRETRAQNDLVVVSESDPTMEQGAVHLLLASDDWFGIFAAESEARGPATTISSRSAVVPTHSSGNVDPLLVLDAPLSDRHNMPLGPDAFDAVLADEDDEIDVSGSLAVTLASL